MRPDSSFLEKPMDAFGTLFREWVYPFLSAGLSLALLLWYLNRLLLTPRESAVVEPTVIWMALGLTVVSLRLLRKKKPPELRLLLQNACWVILSRVILGGLDWSLDSEIYWVVLFFSLFGIGIMLKRKQRDAFLMALTVIVCVTFQAWALAAILTVLKGSSLDGMYRLSGGIQLVAEKMVLSVTFFKIHRNNSAIYFLTPICLILYQCVRHRRWGWYIAAGVSIPLWYAAMALQHCRTAYTATAVCLALLTGHLILRKLRKYGRSALIVSAAAVVVSAAILFGGFSCCGNLISRFSREPQTDLIYSLNPTPEPTATPKPAKIPLPAAASGSASASKPTGTPAPAAAESPAVSVHDERSMLDDALTLSNRTPIWKAILPLLRSGRQLALGRPYAGMMDAINEQLPWSWEASHMHNAVLQQLLMAGVPGALLYLLLLLSLSVRIVGCYFRKDGVGRKETPVLGVLLAGDMLYGMMEPLLSRNIQVTSLLFCLLAGCFVGELSDEEEEDVPGSDAAPRGRAKTSRRFWPRVFSQRP